MELSGATNIPTGGGLPLMLTRRIVEDRWDALRAMNLAGRDHPPEADLALYARNQHISQYLLRKIRSNDAEDLFPRRWINDLNTQTARLNALAERLDELLAEAESALRAAGVETRVLKGRPFATRYYGDAELRRHVDLDLLVRSGDVNAALAALASINFHARRRRVTGPADCPAIKPRLLRIEHAIGLSREDLAIDLHWTLRNAPAYRIAEDQVWSSSEIIRINGAEHQAPSDEYALVLLLVSIAHDLGRGACRVKHLLDVRYFLRSEYGALDWRRFFTRREEENTAGVCANALGVALDVLDLRTDHSDVDAALKERAGLITTRSPEEAIHLVHTSKGHPRNALWLLTVYPTRIRRDLPWWFRRNVPHAGRIQLAAARSMRFLGRLAIYGVSTGLRSLAARKSIAR